MYDHLFFYVRRKKEEEKKRREREKRKKKKETEKRKKEKNRKRKRKKIQNDKFIFRLVRFFQGQRLMNRSFFSDSKFYCYVRRKSVKRNLFSLLHSFIFLSLFSLSSFLFSSFPLSFLFLSFFFLSSFSFFLSFCQPAVESILKCTAADVYHFCPSSFGVISTKELFSLLSLSFLLPFFRHVFFLFSFFQFSLSFLFFLSFSLPFAFSFFFRSFLFFCSPCLIKR